MIKILKKGIQRFQATEELKKEMIDRFGKDHLDELVHKRRAIRNLAIALNMSETSGYKSRIGSVEDVDLVVFLHLKDRYVAEYLVVSYEGGECSVRNCDANSNAANFRQLGELLDGGYYVENFEFEECLNSDEWAMMSFGTRKRFDILVPSSAPNTGKVVSHSYYGRLLEETNLFFDSKKVTINAATVANDVEFYLTLLGGEDYPEYDNICELTKWVWQSLDSDTSIDSVARAACQLATQPGTNLRDISKRDVIDNI